jgi:type VI secretion system protein ImpM
MPMWCFALKGGGVDDCGYAGVMVPGLDAVGRYFPFVIAKRIDPDATAQWRVRGGEWYREVARLALSTLNDDFSLSRLEADLKAVCDAGPDARPLDVRSNFESAWWTLPDDPADPPVRGGVLDSSLFMKLLGQ